jgi:hypothetical protein
LASPREKFKGISLKAVHCVWDRGLVAGPSPIAKYAGQFKQETLSRRRADMLWTIFVILLVLWLLGMVSSYTLGGYIHILLVVAIVVVLIRVIQGRNPV